MSTWMLYALAIGCLLWLAGHCAERVALAAGRGTRWIWLVAIAASTAVPLLVPAWNARYGTHARDVGGGAGIGTIEMIGGIAPMEMPAAAAAVWLERALALGWGAASLGLLVFFVISAMLLRRRRRRWPLRVVVGMPVLVSETTGPALVGFAAPDIVVPAWILDWDERSLRLLVAHEREHERAGDPLLLLVAAGAIILLPWNLPLWWQARRLRLAIEVDCDARVLRRRADVRAYAELLLEVGRCASRMRIPAAAFSGSSSLLERRLRVIGRARPIRRSAVVAFTLMAALPPILLYSLPVPETARIAVLTDSAPAPAPRVVPPQSAGVVDRTGAGSSGASMAAAPGEGEAAIQDRVDDELNDSLDGMADRGTGIAVWTTPGREPHGARPVTLVAEPDSLTRGHLGPDRR